ncbi:lysophospholipase L1-like esterase [Amycolatopsis bartoniae]|uniref:Lipase n=1 Tax=Amycolatopsis bartoniae TaxID=941986 RepID=A0A8H9MFK6_9PSEU|nr:SGNH/GDSL hydrolase family protein [Amycolatopsis bartoniae]MBB2933804.1 lysophospholipase L1-like esterase [Amycolatopsis bartoniae]TVT10538.1 SGNH/GDSL hydrolase family protein [Amycolatopsis bartoniae]GHF87793.1 lipase [Amycolatopsis bartoniae]
MVRKLLVGLIALAVIVAAGAFAYSRSQQNTSASPPAVPVQSGRYVALGDSYTSAPRTGNAAGQPVGCQRSDNNYPHLVAAELHPVQFVDVSCAGATTEHLYESQRTNDGTNPPQLDALTPDTVLVTLGIGGNDVGLIGLIQQCGTDDVNATPCRNRLTAGGRDQLAQRIDQTAAKVGSALTAIHGKTPNARVLLVGYPTVLPDGDGCFPFLPLVPADVAYLRDTADRLNAMLAEQAKTHGADYVDTATPSKGHDLCQKATVKWVEDLVPSAPAAALHPNANGEKAMADAVVRAAG